MADTWAVARFVLLSLGIGVAAFVASYTVLVWTKRNKHTRSIAIQRTLRMRCRSWGGTMLVVGAVIVLAALISRETVGTTGALRGEGLFAVRALPQTQTSFVAPEGPVEANQLLVHFTSPELLSQDRQLQESILRWQAEHDTLALTPLEADKELIRQVQTAETTVREKTNTLKQHQSASSARERECADLILTKERSLTQVAGDLRLNREQIINLERLVSLADEQVGYLRRVASGSGAVSMFELQSYEKERLLRRNELIAVQAKVRGLEAEERQLHEAYRQLCRISNQQKADDDREAIVLRRDIAAASALHDRLKTVIAEDLATLARPRRDRELAKMQARINEARAQRDGITQKQEHRAPFAGQVVFRHSSPGATLENGPILVLARDRSIHFRARVLATQAEALANASSIELELGDEALVRRCSAQFLRATPLAAEPDRVIAELTCEQTPPELIRLLVESEAELPARFRWRPPVETYWPFQIGAAIGLLGLVLVLATMLMPVGTSNGPVEPTPRGKIGDGEGHSYITPAAEQLVGLRRAPVVTPLSESPAAARAGSAIDASTSTAVIGMVAHRLFQSIEVESLTEETVASAEWALDRHQGRAIAVFRQVYASQPINLNYLDACAVTPREEDQPINFSDWIGRRSLLARTIRVLEATGLLSEDTHFTSTPRAA